jgi:hypothetical protein
MRRETSSRLSSARARPCISARGCKNGSVGQDLLPIRVNATNNPIYSPLSTSIPLRLVTVIHKDRGTNSGKRMRSGLFWDVTQRIVVESGRIVMAHGDAREGK